MENPALAQQIKAIFLCGVGLLFALLIGWNIGTENYYPLILGAFGVAVGAFALFSGRFFWVIAIASASLAGTFPILGGSFTPFQFLIGIGVTKFLIEDVVLRRASFKLGDRTDLLLIAGFMGILTLHGIHDRFGMRFLGSNVWGGRNYINVYVGLAAYFVIQSIPMKTRVWRYLPYAILAVTAFDLTIALITTVFPQTIYAIYPFYSAVSRTGIEEIVGADTGGDTARLGSVGNFGVVLVMVILASTSVRRILHPSYFFRIMGIGIGLLAVLFSSFRTSVFNAGTAFFLAGVRDLRFGVVGLFPIIAVVLFGISFVNSEVYELPKAVQRSLTFMPGDWDRKMARDAASSNEFRSKIWTLWLQEYFPLHPVFGRGFGFRSQWAKASVYRWDPNEDIKMVEVGNIHNGFFAALDTFGIIGTIFFVAWNIRMLARLVRVPIRLNDPSGKALPFLALSLGTSILCYWFSASDIGSFLPTEFAIAGVAMRLLRDTKAESLEAQGQVVAPAHDEQAEPVLA